MRFLIQLILITVLAFVFELFLPWWSIAIAAFLGSIVVNTRANFLAGFLGIALLWFFHALIISSSAAAPLADRVAKLFSLNSTLLMVVTALIGGLVGGFAAMAGGALRMNHKKIDNRYYR
jgi:asparagine N-glycosylation enzyme membrane subunit Stt3